MARIKNDLTSLEIKSYINKLYDEIVEEMDSFLNVRQYKQDHKPFSHVFSRLGSTRHYVPKGLSWGKQASLRDKYFSFDQTEKSKPSSHFFSSFDNEKTLKGFSSRKYFSETDSRHSKPSQMPAKEVSSFFKQSPWQRDLCDLEQKVTGESPLKSYENSRLFDKTTGSLIPSLKASLGLFSEPQAGKLNRDTVLTNKPLKKAREASFKETKDEEIGEELLSDLLPVMTGMSESEEKPYRVHNKSINNIDLDKKLTQAQEEVLDSPVSNHENLWQFLEQEGSVKELFAHVKIAKPCEDGLLTSLEETAQASQNVAKQELIACDLHEDPFFASLERTLEPQLPQQQPTLTKEERERGEGPACNRSANSQSNPFTATPFAHWAGELRWQVIARKDLELFKTLLPSGFVLCDGKRTLGAGPFQVDQQGVKGKLPNWIEEIDENHIVVGILKTSPL